MDNKEAYKIGYNRGRADALEEKLKYKEFYELFEKHMDKVIEEILYGKSWDLVPSGIFNEDDQEKCLKQKHDELWRKILGKDKQTGHN